MKNSLLFFSIILLLTSCGTAGRLFDNAYITEVSTGKDMVYSNLDNKSVMFKISSLFDNIKQNPYPVIYGDAARDYESWMLFIKDKPEYQNVLSEKAYGKWLRTATSLLKKHSLNFDSFLFTVPGRVVVYTEEKVDIKKLSRHIDCAMNGYGIYCDRYRYLDFGYKPSLMADNPEEYIFRSVVKDYSQKMLIVIDRIYLHDSNKMLCLMYTCAGNFDYTYDKDEIFHYNGNTSWEKFDPLKNMPMAFEFFYKQCDPISIEAFKYLNKK